MDDESPAVAPIPLRVESPLADGGESDNRELAVTSAFQLPPDWLIEEKPRTFGGAYPGRTDKYYIEPHTGRKFRSVIAVERYLNAGIIYTRARRRSREPEKKSKMPNTTLAIETSPDFVLPDGWRIETHQRHNSVTVDKYYIEPETGKKFRSMISVKKHLQELEAGEISAGSPEPEVNSIQGPLVIEKQILPRITTVSPDFVLPDGWIIRKRSRRNRLYSSTIDKYYVEPETGQEFRSLVSVERYLKEKEEHEYSMTLKEFKRPKKHRALLDCKCTNESQETSPQKVLDSQPTNSEDGLKSEELPEDQEKSEENKTEPEEVKPDNDSRPSEYFDTPKKNEIGSEIEAFVDDFGCPPSTINWVLAGPAGDMWNPYLGEFMIPDSTKQKWSETFISSLDGGK